jgi:hypothetical protein
MQVCLGILAPRSGRNTNAELGLRSPTAMLVQIPGASLFGRFGSLFDRFNSLFGRLGNLLYDAAEINHLAALVRFRRAAECGFSRYLPVDQGRSAVLSDNRPVVCRPGSALTAKRLV